MKNLLILLIILFYSCVNNEQKTIEWIEKAEKPIICRKFGFRNNGEIYTLYSNDGKIYNTNKIYLSLPDTIYNKEKIHFDFEFDLCRGYVKKDTVYYFNTDSQDSSFYIYYRILGKYKLVE